MSPFVIFAEAIIMINNISIPGLRLVSQQIVSTGFKEPEQTVSWMGAIQAQDYYAAKWAIGLRIRGSTDADVEKAIKERKIIRTWPLRGTLHFTAAGDARWMLKLLSPRFIALRARRFKEIGLDIKTLNTSRKSIEEALAGGNILERKTLMDVLERSGISTEGQRGYHILWYLGQTGVICFGPMLKKQQAFVLFEEWVPKGAEKLRDESLAELALRYFKSHGPALSLDFSWWSGLPASDVRQAIELAKSGLEHERINGLEYWFYGPCSKINNNKRNIFLLPGFDEFLIGYSDRSGSLEQSLFGQAVSSNGIFYPVIISQGLVIGLWKREIKRGIVEIRLQPFRNLTREDLKSIEKAAVEFGDFLGLKAVIAPG